MAYILLKIIVCFVHCIQHQPLILSYAIRSPVWTDKSTKHNILRLFLFVSDTKMSFRGVSNLV